MVLDLKLKRGLPNRMIDHEQSAANLCYLFLLKFLDSLINLYKFAFNVNLFFDNAYVACYGVKYKIASLVYQ